MERDVYLASLDQTGKMNWIVNYGGTDNDRAGQIICLDNNDYLIFGNTYSNDVDIDENKGESDIWIVYLETPSQIAEEGQCQFKVATNGNQLFLRFEESFLEPVEILVYDVAGKLVYHDEFSQMRQLNMEIDLPNPLPIGQYFASIRCVGGQTTVPFFYSIQ